MTHGRFGGGGGGGVRYDSWSLRGCMYPFCPPPPPPLGPALRPDLRQSGMGVSHQSPMSLLS